MDTTNTTQPNMGSRFTGWVITIIVLVLLGAGIYYVINMKDGAVDDTKVAGSDYYVSTIQLKHQYTNGLPAQSGNHVYVGVLDLPNPCYNFDTSITKSGDTSAVINIDTSVDKEEMCAQVVTSRSFRLELIAGEKLDIKGYMNGRLIELNIFEVPADQDIDLFEINIKG